jgi:hypothetical protein
MVREFTPSGVSAAEISHSGHGRGDASPKKALSIQWLERLADAGDFGIDSALLAQKERVNFESRSEGADSMKTEISSSAQEGPTIDHPSHH